MLVSMAVAALVVAGTAFAASRLTRNYTPSLPIGVYRLRPELPVAKGEIVDLAIPSAARPLIVGRYLPAGFRLLKRVVAIEGDVVCLTGGWYRVNGSAISPVAPFDSVGRPLPAFSFCGPVPPGMAFVATPVPSSLDSRYFGPVPVRALLSRGSCGPPDDHPGVQPPPGRSARRSVRPQGQRRQPALCRRLRHAEQTHDDLESVDEVARPGGRARSEGWPTRRSGLWRSQCSLGGAF